MTNLIEKSLITGFGIFILIIFFILISPFFNQAKEFNDNDKDDIDNYMDFVEQLDNAILSVIENPNIPYKDYIQCYENLDVIIVGKQVKFYFKLNNEPYYKILEYKIFFYNYTYDYLISEIYFLKIFTYNNNSVIDLIFSL